LFAVAAVCKPIIFLKYPEARPVFPSITAGFSEIFSRMKFLAVTHRVEQNSRDLNDAFANDSVLDFSSVKFWPE